MMMGRKLRSQPSIDELATQAVIKYHSKNIVGGDQIKRRLSNRYGRNRASEAIKRADETYRLLSGHTDQSLWSGTPPAGSIQVKWHAGMLIKGS